METYAAQLNYSEAGYVRDKRSARIKAPPRVIRDWENSLVFTDDFLYTRYRFSLEGMAYLCQLLELSVASATRQSCALTVPQTVCTALRYFVRALLCMLWVMQRASVKLLSAKRFIKKKKKKGGTCADRLSGRFCRLPWPFAQTVHKRGLL